MSVHPSVQALLGHETSAGALVDAGRAPVVIAGPTGAAPMMLTGGAYEGSQRFGDLGMWNAPIQSVDADIIPEKDMLDARANDTLRNDGYVAGGATLRKDNVVGAQFVLNAKPATKLLWGSEDEIWEEEFQEEVETHFGLAAESPNCWFDAQGVKTFTDIIRLAVGVHTAGGEVLASAEWLRRSGRPFKTAIQMIDTDRLSTPWDRRHDQDIRGGVERDQIYGSPLAYHIRQSHPSDVAFGAAFASINDWKRVPAKTRWGRAMILHVYEQMRPDQTRGVSCMVTALMEMKMTKGFRKVELQRAVVAATYAASIESDLPSGDIYAAMGTGEVGDEHIATAWMKEYLKSIEEYSGGSRNLYLDGAKIPVFMPGTRMKLQNPGNTGPMGDKFEQSLLRYIAAALGVSYEQLSRDYTQTNYSSARAAMSETWKFMQALKKAVADKTANFIYRLWFEEQINAGTFTTLKRRSVPNFYEGLNADAYTACEWIGAGQGAIDPLKETQAYERQVNARFSSRERVIVRLHGADWRKEFKQIRREELAAEKLSLNLTADAAPPAADNGDDDNEQPRKAAA